MGLWTKQQLKAFIKENKLVSAQDAQNALKNLFAETIQEMPEAEMDEHLGYQKHDMQNSRRLIAAMARARKTS
jgi:putative transposase